MRTMKTSDLERRMADLEEREREENGGPVPEEKPHNGHRFDFRPEVLKESDANKPAEYGREM